MQKWQKQNSRNTEPEKKNSQGGANYAAIDLGTNSCRLVIASPTPTSFRIVETFSKITRLGEGIINDNELSRPAIKRTIGALKVCAGVLEEYAPIVASRYVATAACRRAKNCGEFLEAVKRETGLNIEIISSKEESRLAVVGCIPLLNRHSSGLWFLTLAAVQPKFRWPELPTAAILLLRDLFPCLTAWSPYRRLFRLRI